MINIIVYEWAGSFGPFKIRSHCEECDITWGLLQSMKNREFKDLNITLEKRPWLNNWWKCLRLGAWHAPIIIINNKKYYQFSHKHPIVDRAALVDYVENL